MGRRENGALRAALGSVFLLSGFLKLFFGGFEVALQRYDLLPLAMLGPLARTLPPLEILVGLGLLSGLALRGSLLWAELLLYLFSAALASVLLRGLKIDCGCLGDYSLPVSWPHALACLWGGAWLTYRRRRQKA